MSLIRVKPIQPSSNTALKRCLNGFDLTLLGIGAIIGAGVFVLTGVAAATKAGPAILLSYIVAGFACAFTALSYAELAASVGGSGSAYGYAYASFGEIFAWFIGWALILEYGLSTAVVAIGWSGYLDHILKAGGIVLPVITYHLSMLSNKTFLVNIPAMFIVACITLLLLLGARESARVNSIMVLIKSAVIILFIAFAIPHANTHMNWHPFMPFGFDGVMQGAALIFFAYIGFDAVSTMTEETINPSRNIPIGILSSLAICTIVYIAVAGLLTATTPYAALNVTSPVAHALSLHGHNLIAATIGAGALAGLTTVILVMFFALTRILLAMANDKLLPQALTNIHPRTQTPHTIIITSGIIMIIASGFLPMTDLASLVNIGTLSAFVFVCVGVIISRWRHPELTRPFLTPAYPLIPVLGALSCAYLMMQLPPHTWQRFLMWQCIGFAMYFLYSRRRSLLH